MKKTVKITMEIDVTDVPGYGDLRAAIHYTLADALGEFRRARGVDPASVKGYVEERYAGQSDVYRVAKVAEVIARVQLAEALRHAINEPGAIDVTQEDVPCRDHWHCLPKLAAHECTKIDRSKPCPTCGALPSDYLDSLSDADKVRYWSIFPTDELRRHVEQKLRILDKELGHYPETKDAILAVREGLRRLP